MTYYTAGFIEHGHLHGVRAFLVDVDQSIGASSAEFLRHVTLSGLRRVHLVSRNVVAASIDRLTELFHICQAFNIPVSISVRPSFPLTDPLMASEAVITITEDDVYGPAYPQRHLVGSISFHTWPGGPTVERLTSGIVSRHNNVFVLDEAELGDAKVWLSRSGRSDAHSWVLRPAYPLNDSMEPAELEEAAR